ncbi:AAA family ATPase [Pseudoalteromonas denitrificans]|uniref:AAA domain-containing protein n=1 Tax=Pseudoalteromonas denitrificans DSM 6059 TaxID=1123010 RepID=A0A1I1T7C2_9GAMM|nr:AAA family ATPase [Pseudoalteromonas denitrificans]SFD54506.1 AAA domain-containing protein [Pseudoalteromonas denitrificans DSM 6059]
MNFTEHYTAKDKKHVLLMNDEIDNFNITETELNCGYAYSQIKTVLAGESPVRPTKLISALWEHIFPNTNADELESTVSKFNPIFNDEDKILCSRIKMRLHSKEMRDQAISASTIAKLIDRSPATVSQLINGKYKAVPTSLLEKIWHTIAPIDLVQADKNAQAEDTSDAPSKEKIILKYGEEPFIQTEVSEMIRLACNQAKQQRRFSVISGLPGVGKSKALAEFVKNNTDTILIDGGEEINSKSIVEELCSKLGLVKASNTAVNIKRIIKVLQNGPSRVIILDEADKCKPNAMDPLRTISDKALIGVSLVGNSSLVDKLQSQERYELIASRVCFWPKPIAQVCVEDIRSLFLKLTQGTLVLADDSDKWWIWLHKRVEGNARELVNNLLPHLLNFSYKNMGKKIDKAMVNSIFASVLNKPAI